MLHTTNITRIISIGGAVAAALVVAACGGSSPSASSSGTSSATAQPSASATSSSSGSGSSGSPADYVLSTSQLPSGTETWQQIADGELNNDPSSRQRAWQNSDNSQRIEIDVLVVSDASTAQSDYQTWQSGIEGKVTQATNNGCPLSGISSCAEFTGQTSDGKSECVVTWQDSNVLAAALLVNAGGLVDTDYCGQVASAEDSQISSTAGS